MKKSSGIALIMSGKPESEEEGEDLELEEDEDGEVSEEEVAAIRAFLKTKDPETAAKALKLFVKSCC